MGGGSEIGLPLGVAFYIIAMQEDTKIIVKLQSDWLELDCGACTAKNAEFSSLPPNPFPL